MRYRDWEPLYAAILRDFGFDRAKDEEAARIAAELLAAKQGWAAEPVKAAIETRIRDRRAFVCGNAPCLAHDLEMRAQELERAFGSTDIVVIAADGATSVLIHAGLLPDIVCTDLDGTIADIIAANRLGTIVVVHAHGDNIPLLKKVIPVLNENLLCTTQSEPLPTVFNFGGLTDGDRCVFLAQACGARSIELIGFDFEDPSVTERKRKKLQWAKRLISAIR
ncbi:MAG TPA: DUF115 domain-containing protein [Methanomicrobia archaeon]|mgnify:CR=1 FL=1|nr:DUF115 domain-containing protein [Methanomicrobia archaeon]